MVSWTLLKTGHVFLQNLGHTLQRLSPHRTLRELSLFIGIGGT